MTPLSKAVAAWRKQPHGMRAEAVAQLWSGWRDASNASRCVDFSAFTRRAYAEEARAIRAAIRLLRAAEKPRNVRRK